MLIPPYLTSVLDAGTPIPYVSTGRWSHTLRQYWTLVLPYPTPVLDAGTPISYVSTGRWYPQTLPDAT
eukprot:3940412-Rhodomonas_salina.2